MRFSKSEVFIMVACFLVGVLAGIIIGVDYSANKIINGVAFVMQGSNVNVTLNLNETKMVQEINKTIVPQLVNAFNNTVK